MSESADGSDLPPAPTEQLIERKVALDGRILEFPLERWLVTPDVVVGRWVADQDPRAISRYPRAGGVTSWGVWWPKLPYSAYRLHRPNGELRIYRLDTVERVIFDGETIEFHDLLLDALIRPDGEVTIETRSNRPPPIISSAWSSAGGSTGHAVSIRPSRTC